MAEQAQNIICACKTFLNQHFLRTIAVKVANQYSAVIKRTLQDAVIVLHLNGEATCLLAVWFPCKYISNVVIEVAAHSNSFQLKIII